MTMKTKFRLAFVGCAIGITLTILALGLECARARRAGEPPAEGEEIVVESTGPLQSELLEAKR